MNEPNNTTDSIRQYKFDIFWPKMRFMSNNLAYGPNRKSKPRKRYKDVCKMAKQKKTCSQHQVNKRHSRLYKTCEELKQEIKLNSIIPPNHYFSPHYCGMYPVLPYAGTIQSYLMFLTILYRLVTFCYMTN